MEELEKKILENNLEVMLKKIKRVGERKAKKYAEDYFTDDQMKSLIATVYKTGFIEGVGEFIGEVYK